jgi:hypothetical protein
MGYPIEETRESPEKQAENLAASVRTYFRSKPLVLSTGRPGKGNPHHVHVLNTIPSEQPELPG